MSDFVWTDGVCENPCVLTLDAPTQIHAQFLLARSPDGWQFGIRVFDGIWRGAQRLLAFERSSPDFPNPNGPFNAAMNLLQYFFRYWPDNSNCGRFRKWLNDCWDGLHWAVDAIKDFPPGGSILLKPLAEEPE